MNTTDFAALRAERNKAHAEWVAKMQAEGWQLQHDCEHNAPNACYCACGRGGPCEHDFTGPTIEMFEGHGYSTTCTHCGMDAYSHSLRNGP